jgi:hypothetical protein
LLRTVPPNLRPYYRQKVNEYFNKLGTNWEATVILPPQIARYDEIE